MRKKLEREKRRYLRSLQRLLGYSEPDAKQLIHELSAQIDAFIYETGVTSFSEVVACFGSAESIAHSMGAPESAGKLSIKARWIRLITVILLAAAAALVAFWIVSLLLDVHYYQSLCVPVHLLGEKEVFFLEFSI